MNAKKVKLLRKHLRDQGINPKEAVYISDRDVLRNNPQPRLSINPSVFGDQTVLLYKECGRAAYKGLKAALRAL
ncbi:hypothetical protein [Companilactobacillus sp.]|uniref:hypothetical protein n=1 Tax=Companilactobacillus sp. TaxID=2767905 RepID=UPI00262D1AA2|nr:hypothetical protein [Companilactobacillus sp.]